MKCPQCNGPIPNALHEGQYSGALSRIDNKTEICSDCGVREAIMDMHKFADARRTTIVERTPIVEEV
jgi:hypothetical protein